ncbi:MAG: RseA family anti-sigma factor [Bermanella sp.]
MSDKQNETLSALMDGELDEMSLQRVLKQTADDPQLKETWSRYHLQRDVIKGDVSAFSTLDISSAIQAAVDQEPTLHGARQPPKNVWKAVAGLSLAASVTFAVVLAARFNPWLDGQGSAPLAATQQTQVVPDMAAEKSPVMIAQGAGTLKGMDEKSLQQAQQRLNIYLKQHAQDSALDQGRSAMPFARVVNFETPAREVKGN